MGRTRSVSPSIPVISTAFPASTGVLAIAFQISSPSRTEPSGASRSITTARCPTSPADPVVTRRVGLIRRKGRTLSPAAQQLYELFAQTRSGRAAKKL